MGAARFRPIVAGPDGAAIPSAVYDPAVDPLPWEEIAAGRYMPRRILGSCRGRELG
jgi:hypothetical protein